VDQVPSSPPIFDVPMSPPVSPAAMPPAQSAWPRVLGILCVVIGVLGFLNYAISVVFSMINFQITDDPAYEAMLEASEKHGWILQATSIGLMLLSMGLLVGGVQLIRRRAASLRILAVWSMLKIIAGFAFATINYFTQREMTAAVLASTQATAISDDLVGLMAIVVYVSSVLWMAALPVFLLVWFRRSAISDETKGWT